MAAAITVTINGFEDRHDMPQGCLEYDVVWVIVGRVSLDRKNCVEENRRVQLSYMGQIPSTDAGAARVTPASMISHKRSLAMAYIVEVSTSTNQCHIILALMVQIRETSKSQFTRHLDYAAKRICFL
jgi:hypothetical protein